MRKITVPTISAAVTLGVAVVLGSCADPESGGISFTGPGADAAAIPASAATASSIAGEWVWSHRTVFVIPTPVAAMVVPEAVHDNLTGPVTRIECVVSGTMNLVQAGSEFSGTSTQLSDCVLRTGPRFAMPFVYQSPFEVSNGMITGRSFTFNVGDGCLNRGNLLATDGLVTGWRATGACEIPLPIQPAVAKTIIWRAERV
jgi:hypothetical protein